MKQCTLVGIGMGNPLLFTQAMRDAIQQAPIVAGAERMIQAVQSLVHGKTFVSIDSKKIAEAFAVYAESTFFPCAVFSGDVGFFSGAHPLREHLEAEGWQVTLLAGITSAQYLAAKLGQPWQAWHLVSAHGTDCNVGIALSYKPATFFLTGGAITVRSIADFLVQQECEATVTVGSRLSYADEVILRGTPAEIAARTDYDEALACVLVERSFLPLPRQALADAFFIRNAPEERTVPMTKRFVRSAILSALEIADDDVVWDVGAGTGAVSIDCALAAHCAVYAVEYKEEACALIRANRKKAQVLNVTCVCGKAPAALADLPAPYAVCIGGSEGALSAIITAVYQKNPNARVVIPCVTTETLADIPAIASRHGMDYEVVHLSVGQSKPAGAYHLMMAQNPVWLVILHR